MCNQMNQENAMWNNQVLWLVVIVAVIAFASGYMLGNTDGYREGLHNGSRLSTVRDLIR